MITIKNRKLIIPRDDRVIGTVSDNNSETRIFVIDRYLANGIDLAALTFGMDMEYEDGTTKNATYLTKEVTDDIINLTWGIVAGDVQKAGTMFVQITAFDYDGTVKWATIRDAFYVEPVIGTAEEYTGDLSAFQRMEAVLDQKLDKIEDYLDDIDDIEAAEEGRISAEEGPVSAESGRVEAEAVRVQNERERQATMSELEEDIEAALQVKDDVEALKQSAAQSASNASTSETNAASSASSASDDALTASNAATSASADALVAEGWAQGTQNGVPVEAGSPYFKHNSKHYMEEAEGIVDAHFVSYEPQSLTSAQQAQVRTNVGAMASDESVVKYSSQTLTDPQKTQARTNINAAGKVSSPTADNLIVQTSSGDIADSGIAKGDVIQSNENLLDNSHFNVCERPLNYYLPPNGIYWETPWSNSHRNDTGNYIPLKKTASNAYELVINGVTCYTTETATNHIINGFAEGDYTVNRWRKWSATVIVDVTSKGITIINNGTAQYLFTQYLEQKLVNLLRGQKVTLSVELQNGTVVKETGTVPNSGSYTLIADGTDIKLRMVINTLSYCDFYVDGTKEIHNVKLEIGGTCTILLDAPRPYAEELARCQTSTADVNDTYANKGNLVTSNSIAPTEDGVTASKAYTVGEFFYRGGDLCKCISAIASDGSFTLNTNYTVTSVTNEIKIRTLQIDATTQSDGNLKLGNNMIPLSFRPNISTNYPCIILTDCSGVVWLKIINDNWGDSFGGGGNKLIKGTLYYIPLVPIS